MSRAALFLELGEDARLVGGEPFLGQFAEHPFALRLALPERADLLEVDAPGLVVHAVGDFFPRIEQVEVGGGVDADFRIGRHGGGGRAAFADDQLALTDVELFVFEDRLEHQRAAQRHRGLGVGRGLHRCRDELGAFDADARERPPGWRRAGLECVGSWGT